MGPGASVSSVQSPKAVREGRRWPLRPAHRNSAYSPRGSNRRRSSTHPAWIRAPPYLLVNLGVSVTSVRSPQAVHEVPSVRSPKAVREGRRWPPRPAHRISAYSPRGSNRRGPARIQTGYAPRPISLHNTPSVGALCPKPKGCPRGSTWAAPQPAHGNPRMQPARAQKVRSRANPRGYAPQPPSL